MGGTPLRCVVDRAREDAPIPSRLSLQAKDKTVVSAMALAASRVPRGSMRDAPQPQACVWGIYAGMGESVPPTSKTEVVSESGVMWLRSEGAKASAAT